LQHEEAAPEGAASFFSRAAAHPARADRAADRDRENVSVSVAVGGVFGV
jgi:hypothetical protein